MKKAIVSAVLFVVVALSAQDVFGQITITYERQSRNKYVSLTYSSGYAYPYGYYAPYYGTSFSPGIIYSRNDWTIMAGTNFLSTPMLGYYPGSSLYYRPSYVGPLYTDRYLAMFGYPYSGYHNPYRVYGAGDSSYFIGTFTSLPTFRVRVTDPGLLGSRRDPSVHAASNAIPVKEDPTPISDRLRADREIDQARQASSRGDTRAAERILKEALVRAKQPSAALKAAYGLVLFLQRDYYYADRALRDALETGPAGEVMGLPFGSFFHDGIGKYRPSESTSGALWDALLTYATGNVSEAIKKIEGMTSDAAARALLNQIKK